LVGTRVPKNTRNRRILLQYRTRRGLLGWHVRWGRTQFPWRQLGSNRPWCSPAEMSGGEMV